MRLGRGLVDAPRAGSAGRGIGLTLVASARTRFHAEGFGTMAP